MKQNEMPRMKLSSVLCHSVESMVTQTAHKMNHEQNWFVGIFGLWFIFCPSLIYFKVVLSYEEVNLSLVCPPLLNVYSENI